MCQAIYTRYLAARAGVLNRFGEVRPTLEEQVLQPITNPKELDMTLPEVEARLPPARSGLSARSCGRPEARLLARNDSRSINETGMESISPATRAATPVRYRLPKWM